MSIFHMVQTLSEVRPARGRCWDRIPVNGLDVHLQAVPTGGPMAALLAHERLFSAMLGCFVHTQLGPGQEGFGTLGTLKRKNQGACFDRTLQTL